MKAAATNSLLHPSIVDALDAVDNVQFPVDLGEIAVNPSAPKLLVRFYSAGSPVHDANGGRIATARIEIGLIPQVGDTVMLPNPTGSVFSCFNTSIVMDRCYCYGSEYGEKEPTIEITLAATS